jgi:hypothetical protein
VGTFLTSSASEIYGPDSYTIGQDGEQIDLLDSSGNIIDLGADIVNFTFRENYDQLNPKVITGKPRPRAIPETVSGSFEFLRYTGAIEQLFSNARAQFFATGQTATYSIRQTVAPFGVPPITNVFTGVTLMLEDGGTYARDAEVHVRVTFDASDWVTQ